MDESIESKRNAVKLAYRNATWADKVDHMSDAQVTAVYLRLKAQNKI